MKKKLKEILFFYKTKKRIRRMVNLAGILVLTFPFMFAWQLFKQYNEIYYLFLSRPEIGQKLKFYALHTSYYMNEIILLAAIVYLTGLKFGRKAALFPFMFMCMDIFRLYNYWDSWNKKSIFPIIITCSVLAALAFGSFINDEYKKHKINRQK